MTNRIKHYVGISILSGSLIFAGCEKADTENEGSLKTDVSSSSPASSNAIQNSDIPDTGFLSVYPKLDENADLVLYWNSSETLQNLENTIKELPALMSKMNSQGGKQLDQASLEEMSAILNILAAALKSTGISEISGMGLSNLKLDESLHRTKVVLNRAQDSQSKTFWDLFGQPKSLKSHFEKLPGSSVAAQSGHINFAEAFSLINNFVTTQLPEDLQTQYQQVVAGLDAQVNFRALLNSMTGGYTVSLMFNDQKIITLPAPENPIEIPEPSFAISIDVKNPTIIETIKNALGEEAPVQPIEVEGGEGFRLMVPLPIPLRFQPSFLSKDDRFIFASNPEAALALLDPSASGTLADKEEAQSWINKIGIEGNSLTFVSRELGATVQSTLNSFFKGMENPPANAAPFIDLLQQEWNTEYSGVTRIDKEGLYLETYSTAPTSTFTALASTGIFASITLPAVTKARARAREVACLSHMKQIMLGIKIYESENNGAFPEKLDDIAEYVGAPMVFKCPSDESSPIDKATKMDDPDWKNFISYEFNPKAYRGPETLPNTAIIKCPFHGHIGYYDGSVRESQ